MTFVDIPASRRLRPLAILLVALGVAWAPQAERMPLWMSPTLAALAALRFYLARRGFELKQRKLLLVPTLLAAYWAIASYRGFFGGRGAMALLTVMVALKLFESYKLRDFLLLVLVGYVLTATRILSAQTPASAVMMLLLCAVFTYLLVEYSDRTARRRVRDNAKIVLRLMVFALPIMALLYVFFPRSGSPLWVLSGGGKAVTGISDEMRPGSIGKLVTSDEVAFIVDFDGPLPQPDQLYWRGLVFDTFDGEAWRASKLEPVVESEAVDAAAANTFEQRISLFPHTGRWIYALDRPVVNVAGQAPLRLDGTLLTKRPISDQRNYRVTSSVPLKGALPAQTPPTELTAEQRARMLELPEGFSPRVMALASELAAGAADDDEIVTRALAYFREQGFTYTLDPPVFEESPTENFLLESREGFCEHFATGLAALMRGAGVPSRIVVGYLGAETNPWFTQMTVQQLHAHAWNEVWLEDKGWTRIDPTAVASPGRLTSTIDADASLEEGFIQFGDENSLFQHLVSTFGFSYLTIYQWWSEWVVGYNRQKQLELLSELGTGLAGRAILFVLCAGLTATWLAAVLATILTGEKKRTDPFDRIWRRWLRKMGKTGYHPEPHEGALDFGRRIAKDHPEMAGDALKITTFYSRCRYGQPLGKDLKERVRVFGAMVQKSKIHQTKSRPQA
jgi:transglutaminase-like putative cysteine protease